MFRLSRHLTIYRTGQPDIAVLDYFKAVLYFCGFVVGVVTKTKSVGEFGIFVLARMVL